ncbi:hypothetical protein Lsai_3261 [Legionella sainthelensi]|uniref:Uncharacterized protein n=1 Tax=Legionella sainthelensi TaxID=28087 RepID=A0A0W0YC56_9GAMM|nr:hypothetical protein [Legionella sainthelensi]KTD54439.1 hypothetical protein Lsai_3261 [Legionella sainthelensi]VEH33290.1 Uncharacterised protein [Legionella sainthelensi]
MNGEEGNNELSHWFSTYGAITAERILGKYQVNLEYAELVEAVKTPTSLYHHLVQVPLRNVLNGIILEQANDYHVYAQKLFIDYLLSGESAKDEEAQGAATREALERERQQLISLGDEFHKTHGQHDYLIAESQSVLIKVTQMFNSEMEKAINALKSPLKTANFSGTKSEIRKAIRHALIYCNIMDNQTEENKLHFIEKMNETLKASLNQDLKARMVFNLEKIFQIESDFDVQIKEYIIRAEEITESANAFRNQFYDTILRVVELLKFLPDYKIDPSQDAINREPLYFDKSIGSGN